MTAPVRVRRRFGPAILMGGGLLVVGAAGYGFLALSGHTLAPADAAALASLYLIINIIGPGVFAALEQETSRTVSAHLAGGNDAGVVRRRAALAGLGLLGMVVLALLAIAPMVVPSALGGRGTLFAAMIVGSVTSALVYLVRGLLGGARRFAGYAATLAVEGLARLLPCLVVAVAGGADAAVYALLFAAGSGLGAVAGVPWLRRADRPSAGTSGTVIEPASPGTGPVRGATTTGRTGTGTAINGATATATAVTDITAAGATARNTAVAGATAAGMARAVLVLAGSTLLAQWVANLAPVVVSARMTADTATAAAFASAFVLVRIPLLLSAPVQAMLLPTLTATATRGELAELRRVLRLALAALGGLGAVGVLASFAVGPWAVRVLFGAHVSLSGPLLGALAVGTVALMAAQVLQPTLVALARHRSATASWTLGSVALTGLLFLPGDPLRAALVAQLAGAGLVVAGMAASLAIALRDLRG